MQEILTELGNTLNVKQYKLDVQASNLANNFTDGYNQIIVGQQVDSGRILRPGYGGDSFGNQGSVNAVQTNASVTVSSSYIDFTPGKQRPGQNLDLAMNSSVGFFMVSSDGTLNKNNLLLSKKGVFKLSAGSDILVDEIGRPVLAFKIVNGVVDKSQLGFVHTNGEKDLGWTTGGILVNNFEAAQKDAAVKTTPLYQIALATVANPSGLSVAQGTAYAVSPASGSIDSLDIPGVNGFSTVTPQAVQESNIFYIGEALKSLKLQRDWSATLSVVQLIGSEYKNAIQSLSAN